jgi:predicted dehydrogenase
MAGKRAVLCEKPLAISRSGGERIAAASSATGVPVIVGTMHAWDPAWQAARGFLGDLSETARVVRSTIYLPADGDLIKLATDLVAAPPRGGRSAQSPVDRELETISSGVLALAMHALPLIRTLIPGMTRVTQALALEPWGYSVSYEDGDRSATLIGLEGGPWAPQWTLDAWGATTELHVDFPPSYVTAGSATAAIHTASGTRSWRFGTNGYHAEWLQLADVAEGRAEQAIPLQTIVDDLACAVAIAEAAVALRRAERNDP